MTYNGTIYFTINGNDYSRLVSSMKVSKAANYTLQTNAAGNAVVDYINTKRTIEVGFIPMETTEALDILQAADSFAVNVAFFEPTTNSMGANVACIVPDTDIDFYRITSSKKMLNGFSLTFIEL